MFEKSGKKVIEGQWCPQCKISVGEEIVRCYFEKIFNKKFLKAKPYWLINEDGNKMELDGYCEELGLAYEHNGRQHDQEVKFFKMSGEKLRKRIKDDITKNELCKKHSVILITVPEIFSKIYLHQLKDFLKNKLIENNVNIPENYDDIDFNINALYMTTKNDEIENRLLDIVKSKNGILLSKYYSTYVKLKVQCEFGHIWEISHTNIIAGYWCPECNGGVANSPEKIKEIINKINIICDAKNGKCLSNDLDEDNKVLLECNNNHSWKARYNHVLNGTWCPKCAGKNATIEDMKELAISKNGICLSDEYSFAIIPLKWQCAFGHIWMACPGGIKRGKWCPHCALLKNKGAVNIIKIKPLEP